MDNLPYRPGTGATGRQPFCWRRGLVGTEVAGDWAGCGVSGSVIGSGVAGPELTKSGAPEFRICNRGPVYCFDQSNARQLQTGDDPASLSDEIWSHYLYNIVIWAPGNMPR